MEKYEDFDEIELNSYNDIDLISLSDIDLDKQDIEDLLEIYNLLQDTKMSLYELRELILGGK